MEPTLGPVQVESSSKVFVLWEREADWTDNLGTLHNERVFQHPAWPQAARSTRGSAAMCGSPISMHMAITASPPTTPCRLASLWLGSEMAGQGGSRQASKSYRFDTPGAWVLELPTNVWSRDACFASALFLLAKKGG